MAGRGTWTVITASALLVACAGGDGSGGPDAGPDACVAATELCNATDDDCDGVTDEGYANLGAPCSTGSGACVASGKQACTPAGDGVACDAVAGTGGDETCNEIDDDCDGPVDEGFDLGEACDGADSDECKEGVNVCALDGTVSCDDATGSTVETCNGMDDDCVNGIDDGFEIDMACSNGTGACAVAGTTECNTAGDDVVCDAVAGAPTAEICGDSIDQDCNGVDVACPINDAPAGAVDISAGGTFTVDLSNGTNDQDLAVAGCGLTGGRDVFYTFTLPAAEVVYFATFGSNFDSTLRLFAGSCTALGANVACSDDSCAGQQGHQALQLAAGTYCLVLDQYSSAQTSGSAVLTFARGGRSGTALAGGGTFSFSGTTVGATNQSPSASCQANASGPDVGYYFLVCPGVTKTMSANTCSSSTDWDSVLSLRRAPSTSIACGDDSASCGSAGRMSTFAGASVSGPGLFWLIVDGYNGNSGAFTLNVTGL